MSLIEQLTSQLGGDSLTALAKQLNIDEGVASSAVKAALPMIIGAMARNNNKAGGGSMLDMLDADQDGSIMDDLMGFLSSSNNGIGPSLIEGMLGGKRGTIEQGIGKAAGLDSGTAGALLENLAPIVMGQLGKQKREQGLDTSAIGDLLNQEVEQVKATPAGGGALDMLNSVLDADGDGNALDDVAGMLGKLF